ncbi:MAG: hypothetical protein V4563_14505 [Pseudomonadota bacterium]
MPAKNYYTKHGHARKNATTRTFQCWCNMRNRCTNPKYVSFHKYGGKGITVCQRWTSSFEAFLEDMGECPPKLEIDRYPNRDGNYEPGNCRWATKKQQARNRETNRVFTVFGITASVTELAELFGMPQHTLFSRLDIQKWTIEKALTFPVKCRSDCAKYRILTVDQVLRKMAGENDH